MKILTFIGTLAYWLIGWLITEILIFIGTLAC